MTSEHVEQFLHGVPKTGVVTECFKSDISQTTQNLNNYEPKLRISFQINMVNIRYISNSEKKVGGKKKKNNNNNNNRRANALGNF